MIDNGDSGQKLDVIEAIDLAIKRTRSLLFEPFSFNKWLYFGVMIFLGLLGGGAGLTNYASFLVYFQGIDFEGVYFDAEGYVLDNLSTILVMTVPILAVITVIAGALMYVGARGTMTVIRAVAHDDDDIGENWQSVATPSWTYFVFRLELAVAMGVYVLVAGFVGLLLARQQAFGDVPEPEIIVGLVSVISITTLVSVAYALTMFSMQNFIAPLIFHLNISCAEAWGEFFSLVRNSPVQFMLYLLIKIIFSFVFGVARSLVGCCTCYLGFLPVISQSLLAPLYVFERAYSLYVIGSLGPEYAIIHEPRPPEPPMLPPAINAPPPPNINH